MNNVLSNKAGQMFIFSKTDRLMAIFVRKGESVSSLVLNDGEELFEISSERFLARSQWALFFKTLYEMTKFPTKIQWASILEPFLETYKQRKSRKQKIQYHMEKRKNG